MPRTHIEALVEQWLRLQGYITWTNVPYWRPKQPGKRQGQWGEIDVVGLKGDRAILVECRTFLGTEDIAGVCEKIVDKFHQALKVFRGNISNPLGVPCPDLSKIQDDKIKYLVIAETPPNLDSYKAEFGKLEPKVDVRSFKEVIQEVIKKLPSDFLKVGKYEDFLLRLLISLLAYEMLKT